MTKTVAKVAVLYTLFAVLSTAINIGSQMVSIWAYKGPLYVEISILVGTAMGLPLRYFLEKRYIFAFTSRNLAHDGKLFIFYSAMGVITTLIFWSTEYAFHLIYDTDFMRYVGGVVGLAIGFYVKYQLDKKYVFVNSSSEVVK
ncbi:GtrA family protein [Alphaproteobacteria bacterium]|nr:GtrA family protein [Alphaproteobacteria bacterium]